MKTRCQTNSAELVRKMIEQNLSSKEAAQIVGLPPAHFSQLIQRDRPINYKTAAALKKAFGTCAVVIV